MKAIWAAILGLMLAGVASAQYDITDFERMTEWNLFHATPGFAAGWADTLAEADWDYDAHYGTFGKLAPYTAAQVIFTDPTGSLNEVRDPTANLNLTTVAIAGLGVDHVTAGEISDKTQEWQSYASAAGMAETEVSAIRNAWTIAQFDVDADVDPYVSTSEVEGIAFGVADHVNFPKFT